MRPKTGMRAFRTAAAVAVLLATASSTSAYIDAGSGSYIFQLVIGAIVGSAVAVKLFWRRVSALLFRRGPRRTAENGTSAPR